MDFKMFVESLNDSEKIILIKELNKNHPEKGAYIPNIIEWGSIKHAEKKISTRLFNRIQELFDNSSTIDYADIIMRQEQGTPEGLGYRNLGARTIKEYFNARKEDFNL